jgi:AraC-like DNA-binding protein
MVRKAPNAAGQGLLEFTQSARGETFPFRQFFDLLREAVDHGQGFLVSSLPRGGLQIVQPPRLPELLIRAYGREFHAYDRAAWGAIVQGKPVARDERGSGEGLAGKLYSEMLAPLGVAYTAAAPMRSPVMDGYVGALVLMRGESAGPFSEEELGFLGDVAEELNVALRAVRLQRGGECGQTVPHQSEIHQFIFDGSRRAIYGQAALEALDDQLRQNIDNAVRQRLAHVNGQTHTSDRVSLADSRGDLWNFRIAMHMSYPALSDGTVVFLCLQPECEDWGRLRQGDFQAAGELSRLIPALKYMHENFAKGPTLHEISRAVHLSPFHFHRRFTELLGITPKHFLLDCQIEWAKQMLVEGRKDLSDVAAACGFAHQSHFTSRFKQATGLTPTRWRRMAIMLQSGK